VLVAESSDSISIPLASANGLLYSPWRIHFVVTSQPAAALDIRIDIQCSRERVDHRIQRDLTSQAGPVTRSIKLPVVNPEICYFDVTAGYDDVANQAGEIRLE